MALSLMLGMLIGVILGITGAGGGVLAVPALVFGMGWSMQQAAPVALVAVAAGAGLGALDGLRQKLVRYRAAILMAGIGILFTPLGVQVAHVLPQSWLTILFAMVMLLIAVRLLRVNDVAIDHAQRKFGSIVPETGKFDWNWPTAFLLGAIGALTGFVTGLLGVGGGFLMVPMLRRFTSLSMSSIVVTSLLVIAIVGTMGVLTAFWHGTLMSFQVTIPFASSALAGMLLGRMLTRYLKERYVQYSFATILVIVACSLIVKQIYL